MEDEGCDEWQADCRNDKGYHGWFNYVRCTKDVRAWENGNQSSRNTRFATATSLFVVHSTTKTNEGCKIRQTDRQTGYVVAVRGSRHVDNLLHVHGTVAVKTPL